MKIILICKIVNKQLISNMIRKVFILFSFLLLGNFSFGQVVTTSPEFPTPDEPVTVTFHADRGNQGLKDYSGDVYAHTGLITEKSTNSGDWQYKIANWDDNTSKAKMTQVESNTYELDVTPDIRSFYGVPDDEQIEQMAFVFRNGDGTLEGKTEDGGDIFAEVYPPGLNVNISQPGPNTIVSPGDTVDIEATTNEADSLFLFIEDTLKKEVKDTAVNYQYIPTSKGNYDVVVKGSNAEEAAYDTACFHVKGETQNLSMPETWQKGINYISHDSVGLAIYAPYKNYVYAIGDFSDWRPDEANLMHYDADKDIYWTGIGGLTPGEQYIFQYLIDGEMRIADPYSEQVSTPNDRYISEEIYPDLIKYPAEHTSQIASVLETQQAEYNWQNTDFTPPKKEDLVIYELLIRDFLDKHNYQTLIDTLSYLKNLGINAIELMPVNEFEGNSSWGYNPSFYFAPDKYYGPKEDLKAFIDSCHGQGIAVIQDMVLNHSYGQSPMLRMYFNPEAGEYGKPTAENPWYNEECPHPPYCWGFDFDHQAEATQEFVDSVNTFWLDEYNVDGFRFDFTKGFTNNSSGDEGWSFDQQRIDILKRMADEIWKINSKAYVILEHFTENSEEKELANYGMMTWGNLNHSYNEGAMGYNSEGKSDFSGVSYLERGWTKPHLVGYMESHDEQRLMYKNLEYGNAAENYDITQLETALDRIKLAATFFIPVPGPKMIWQFGELGYDHSIDYDCRTCPKPIKWDYFEDKDRKSLYNLFKVLIHLRENYEVFGTDDFSMEVSSAMKRIVLRHSSSDVVIVGNFGVTEDKIAPEFTKTGIWYEAFSQDTMRVEELNSELTLSAGEYRLYSSEKFDLSDIISPSELDEITTIQSFAGQGQIDVFPNPARDVVTFEFETSGHSEILLNIYNMAGQKVASVKKAALSSGKNRVEWSKEAASAEDPNMFFYELLVGDKRFTGKFLKY